MRSGLWKDLEDRKTFFGTSAWVSGDSTRHVGVGRGAPSWSLQVEVVVMATDVHGNLSRMGHMTGRAAHPVTTFNEYVLTYTF